jgi:hypothetical protein
VDESLYKIYVGALNFDIETETHNYITKIPNYPDKIQTFQKGVANAFFEKLP